MLYLISGKAQHGKDTVAKIIEDYYAPYVKTVPFANYLKGLAYEVLGWDGKKDIKGRRLLQHLGDLLKEYHGETYLAEIVADQIRGDLTYIVPDWRFEYELIPLEKFNPIKIKVVRPNFENNLSTENKNHISETHLDNYDKFDYVIINDDLKNLKEQVLGVINENIKREDNHR